jgi:hypothetical protein
MTATCFTLIELCRHRHIAILMAILMRSAARQKQGA